MKIVVKQERFANPPAGMYRLPPSASPSMICLPTAERSEEGWVIIRREDRNDDPWVMDDCWHRGATTRFSVAGTRISFEGSNRVEDGKWPTMFDDTMKAIKKAGYTGIVEVIGGGEDYRRIFSLDNY